MRRCHHLFMVLFISTRLVGFASHALAQTSPATMTPAANLANRVHGWESAAVSITLSDAEPPLKMPLKQLMNTYKIPGLSIAVMDHFEVVWAQGYGTIEPGSDSPVTIKTLFQAGSISKPLTAAAALSLVERGKLVLDGNVNDKLKTWKIPDNDFTKTEKVTLRRLLSHSGGLTVHGFPGYDIDAPLPTLVQVLNGEKPANTEPIRVDFVPGSKFRYSGGGVTIEQLLIQDVTGKPFPTLMRETVLDKIGMLDSSYEQPLPPARAAVTAGGTDLNGKPVHGRWHIYPEMAAAGLWTTPTDLARFAIEIALSSQGKSNRILSEEMTKKMLTPVLDDVSMGFFLDKDNPGQFGHNGADEGFQAILTMNADTGKGVVVMANSDSLSAVGDSLVQSLAKAFDLNYKVSPNVYGTVLLITRLKGATAALLRYDELKKANSQSLKMDEGTLNDVGYTLLELGQGKDAVAVFRHNVDLYPQSSDARESLGEAYVKTGQNEPAAECFRKSLQLNPKNQSALKELNKLKKPQ